MNNDTISRQAAIDAILHNQEVYSNNFGDDPIDKYTIAIIENDAQTIVLLPSAERRGRWEWNNEDQCFYSCSNCGHKAYGNTAEIVSGLYNYCPNCGAQMKESEWTGIKKP